MRLDPLRMAVAALALGPDIALAPFLCPPPDRARRTYAKSLRRRSTGQSARNRVNGKRSLDRTYRGVVVGR